MGIDGARGRLGTEQSFRWLAIADACNFMRMYYSNDIAGKTAGHCNVPNLRIYQCNRHSPDCLASSPACGYSNAMAFNPDCLPFCQTVPISRNGQRTLSHIQTCLQAYRHVSDVTCFFIVVPSGLPPRDSRIMVVGNFFVGSTIRESMLGKL